MSSQAPAGKKKGEGNKLSLRAQNEEKKNQRLNALAGALHSAETKQLEDFISARSKVLDDKIVQMRRKLNQPSSTMNDESGLRAGTGGNFAVLGHGLGVGSELEQLQKHNQHLGTGVEEPIYAHRQYDSSSSSSSLTADRSSVPASTGMVGGGGGGGGAAIRGGPAASLLGRIKICE